MMNRQPPGADTEPVDQRVPFRHPEAELLRLYGSHTLAFFGLAPKIRHFLAPDGEGLVELSRSIAKVVWLLGDPLCAAPSSRTGHALLPRLLRAQRCHVACYQVCPQHLAAYRALQLHTFKMGEEAILNPKPSPCVAQVWQSTDQCRRAEREGVYIQWYEGVPSPLPSFSNLMCLSNAWLEHKASKRAVETGYSVGRLGGLDRDG